MLPAAGLRSYLSKLCRLKRILQVFCWKVEIKKVVTIVILECRPRFDLPYYLSGISMYHRLIKIMRFTHNHIEAKNTTVWQTLIDKWTIKLRLNHHQSNCVQKGTWCLGEEGKVGIIDSARKKGYWQKLSKWNFPPLK